MTTRKFSAILLFVAALVVQHAQGDRWDQDYDNAMVDCCIEKGGTLKYLQVDTLCEYGDNNSYKVLSGKDNAHNYGLLPRQWRNLRLSS